MLHCMHRVCPPRPLRPPVSLTLRHFQQTWFWFCFTRTYVSTDLHSTSSRWATRPSACTSCTSSKMAKYSRGLLQA